MTGGGAASSSGKEAYFRPTAGVYKSGEGLSGKHREPSCFYGDVPTRSEEILEILSSVGRTAIADRIRQLDEMIGDGAGDERPIRPDSLRALALFLLSEPHLVDPEITVGPNGMLLAEWASAQRGVLAVEFLPDEIIRFAAVSGIENAGSRSRLHGEAPKDRTMKAVRDFIPSGAVPDS